ncbi:MAG: acetyltransferase [Thermodesulfobacteriota bacterium]
MHYDVFNGDADGICALHQLRLAEPRLAALVTGTKRDVRLLARIAEVRQAHVTVCDISLDTNRAELVRLLDQGCQVLYFDHHFPGEIPGHPHLAASIDPDPEVCTAMIVDRQLDGAFRPWAVAAAFGDNLHASALALAAGLAVDESEVATLRELGELMNYNGYGATLADLLLPPAALYESLRPYRDPLAFARRSPVMAALRQGYQEDMAQAAAAPIWREGEGGRLFLFPAEPWSKRAAGVFMNAQARERPESAHGLLVDNGDATFLVSVRAPLSRRTGADTLCRAFPTGGGRAAAAGINALPAAQLEAFVAAFQETFRG